MIWALVALGIVAIFPKEHWLTDVARPIVKVDSVSEKVTWLADNCLLLLSTQEERQIGTDAQGQSVGSPWQGTVNLVNTGTHSRKRLNALTGLLNLTGLHYRTLFEG